MEKPLARYLLSVAVSPAAYAVRNAGRMLLWNSFWVARSGLPADWADGGLTWAGGGTSAAWLGCWADVLAGRGGWVTRRKIARTPFTTTTISTAHKRARPIHTPQRPPAPRQPPKEPRGAPAGPSGSPAAADLSPRTAGCGPRSTVDLRAIAPPSSAWQSRVQQFPADVDRAGPVVHCAAHDPST